MIRAREPWWPTGVEGAETLVELALDLSVPWKHASNEIWGQLEPELWSLTHNPWLVLQTVSPTRLAALCADRAFNAPLSPVLSPPSPHDDRDCRKRGADPARVSLMAAARRRPRRWTPGGRTASRLPSGGALCGTM